MAFRARDRDTDRDVVLRRFFPFGPEGGGLEEEERKAYEVAVGRLTELDNRALRKVIEGGCDPDDGMPYLVTEWNDGKPLSERLLERPLSPISAKALADEALECCITLSETFQQEDVWIGTDPETILLGESDGDVQVTFWISVQKWLSGNSESNGLAPIVELIENVTGWNDGPVEDSEGGGLGWWLKRLRENPTRWSLADARTSLHLGPPPEPAASAPAAQPAAATKPATVAQPVSTRSKEPPTVALATAPALPQSGALMGRQPGAHPQTGYQAPMPQIKSNPWGWIMGGVVVAILMLLVFWQIFTAMSPQKPSATEEETAGGGKEVVELTPAEKASALAERLANGSGSTVDPDDSITFETRVTAVTDSDDGKMTIDFAADTNPQFPQAVFFRKAGRTAKERLDELVGKKVRVTGVTVLKVDGTQYFKLESLDDIVAIGS